MNAGRVRQPFIKDGEQEYIRRINAVFSVTLQELNVEASSALSTEEVKNREAREILSRAENYAFIVALDEEGDPISSDGLCELLKMHMSTGTKSICFIIGGPFGLAESVRQRANRVLSLSALTLPHQLARLVLVEQLYRAFTMIRGVPYHK